MYILGVESYFQSWHTTPLLCEQCRLSFGYTKAKVQSVFAEETYSATLANASSNMIIVNNSTNLFVAIYNWFSLDTEVCIIFIIIIF